MTRLPSAPKPLLWALAAITAALYCVLAYGSYVTMPSFAGGVLGFDMRPMGMSWAEAGPYLAAMTEAGRSYYADWLKPLDTAFILALTVLVLLLSLRFRGAFGLTAALAGLTYAGFDLAENELVASLIGVGTKGSTEAVVRTIAALTTGKFLSLGIAALALLAAWSRGAQPSLKEN